MSFANLWKRLFPMTNDITAQDRELLAAEYEASSWLNEAEELRAGEVNWDELPALRAISKIRSQLEEVTRERDALKSAKWDVKHIDSINEKVQIGLARDAAEADRTRLTDLLRRVVGIHDDYEAALSRRENGTTASYRLVDALAALAPEITSTLERS